MAASERQSFADDQRRRSATESEVARRAALREEQIASDEAATAGAAEQIAGTDVAVGEATVIGLAGGLSGGIGLVLAPVTLLGFVGMGALTGGVGLGVEKGGRSLVRGEGARTSGGEAVEGAIVGGLLGGATGGLAFGAGKLLSRLGRFIQDPSGIGQITDDAADEAFVARNLGVDGAPPARSGVGPGGFGPEDIAFGLVVVDDEAGVLAALRGRSYSWDAGTAVRVGFQPRTWRVPQSRDSWGYSSICPRAIA